MTHPGARHPRCGGVWRGPLADDTGTWLVCNTCGEQIPTPGELENLMDTTPERASVQPVTGLPVEQFGTAPTATCSTGERNGRRQALRQVAQQARERADTAARSLSPLPGTGAK